MEKKLQTVKWERSRIPQLYPAFQKGVHLRVRLGGSLRSLLCGQLGLDPDYVKNRIQTAFLNGRPVDDFDETLVGERDVLTLSGALPGLAGATLRKGGFYRAMRASVSYTKGPEKKEGPEGFVTVRIFNILLPELAPVLLAHGIFYPRKEILSFLEGQEPENRRGGVQERAEGAPRKLSGAGEDPEMGEEDLVRVQSEV